MKRRVLEALARIRVEVDEATREVELEPDPANPGEDEDLLEVRSRVDALEARVASIEERSR